jgi:hypothetical protein
MSSNLKSAGHEDRPAASGSSGELREPYRVSAKLMLNLNEAKLSLLLPGNTVSGFSATNRSVACNAVEHVQHALAPFSLNISPSFSLLYCCYASR